MPETTGTIAFDRDTLAAWYARRHMDIDEGVVKILHLPTNAGPREIRFLEVNQMIPETTPEPIDFGVNIGGEDAHVLNVLDVTPSQWEGIREGTVLLPPDWSLDGSLELAHR